MMKKLLSLAICICLTLGCLCPGVQAAETTGTCGASVTWELTEDGTLIITGTGAMTDYGYKMPPWYDQCDKVVAVEIAEGVTRIGDYAFYKCGNLESIVIPKSVKSIGFWSFAGCPGLTQVTFLGSAPTIGSTSFKDVVATVGYPCSNTTWTQDKLSNYGGTLTWQINHQYDEDGNCIPCISCGEQVTWDLTDGVLTISGSGDMENFDNECAPWYGQCESIVEVIISDGVTSISSASFECCYNLVSVEIPEGVTGIGAHAFQGCASLKSVVLPESLVELGDYSFDSCGLTSLVIPANVTTIGEYAFSYCSSLRSITFLGAPAIAAKSFSRVTATATYPCDNAAWTADKLVGYGGNLTWEAAHNDCQCEQFTWELTNGVLTVFGSGDMPYYEPELAPWYSQSEAVEKIVISEGITSVSEFAFQGCMNATELVLPESLAVIGDYAFDSCGLTSIVIPANVTTVGEYAFSYCSSLWSITFLGAPSIAAKSFSRVTATATYPCDNAAWIADKLTGYGGTLTWEAAHNDCQCDQITWDLTDGVLTIYGSGDMPNYEPELTPWFECQEDVVKIVISEGITSVGEYAFQGCMNATQLVLPQGVTGIGACAFQGCTALESLVLPESLEVIGDYAFDLCSAIERITFLGAPSIAAKSFSRVTATATYPCDNAAWTADKLVGYGGNLTWEAAHGDCQCEQITWDLTDGVLTISGSGDMPNYEPELTPWFECQEDVVKIVISEGITAIGEYAFQGCMNATQLVLPQGVTGIGACAFQGCTALESLVLPESLEVIGDYAFDLCSALERITFLGAPSIAAKSFSRVTATATYPCDNAAWTADKLVGYGGTLTWEAAHNDCQCEQFTWELTDGVLTIFGSGDMPIYEPELAPWYDQSEAIEKIVISEGITSISEFAFQGCMNLTAVELPDSLTTIGDYAFDSCGLTALVVPASVTAIGEYAFSYCNSLRKITFLGNAPTMNNSFAHATADAFYPCGDDTWTEDTMATTGGTLTWKADHRYENGACSGCGVAHPSNKVTGLYSDNVTTFNFDVHWNPMPGAVKYWVYINGFVYNSTRDTTTVHVLKRTANYQYTVSVIALMEDGTILPLAEADQIVVKTEPYKFTFTRTTDSITLIWDVVGCTKSWVNFGTSEDNLTRKFATTESSYTMTGLEPGTVYYFQMSHMVNGSISTMNYVLALKTNELTPAVEGLKFEGATNDSFRVGWDALAGATKYWVYVDGQLAGSSTGTNLTVINRQPGTTYEVAVIAKLENGKMLLLEDAKTILVTTSHKNGIVLPDDDF